MPKTLSRDATWQLLMDREVKGKTIGMARLALRMTIKNVWDYPEMQRRGILSSKDQQDKTIKECGLIISAAEKCLRQC